MTYQGHGCRGADGSAQTRRRRAAVLPLLAASLAAATPGHGGGAKRDFRGLETGMTVAQAEAAAARNGMTCETGFARLTTCRGDGASVVLATTGRRGNHIWELQVSLAGHYDTREMMAKLDAFYCLKPTTVPNVYDTASGQQLMLLSIGGTSTVFYLRSEAVLRDDSQPLPPPRL